MPEVDNMSNQPLPENLITGYLDNQLSPEERAELEQLLRDNPDSQKWLEQLQADKELVGSLPRFSLDANFVDRVMSDDRVEQVFGKTAAGQVAVAGEDGLHQARSVGASVRSSRMKMIVVAVGSLAALVLIALSVPLLMQPIAKLSATSEAEIAESAGNAEVAKDAERKDNDLAKEAPSEKGLGGNTDLSVAEGLDDSEESELMEPAAKPNSKVQSEIANEIESDDEAMEADELGMQLRITNEPMPSREAARERGAVPTDVPGKLARPSRLSGQENKRLADADLKFELKEASEQTLNRPAALNDVLEIEYRAGSEMRQRFLQTLQKNAISFAATDDRDESNELEESLDVPLRDEDNGAALVMFELTATPSQVAGLIADVQSDAVVTKHSFDIPDSGMPESRMGVLRLAELIDGKKADALGSDMNLNPSIASRAAPAKQGMAETLLRDRDSELAGKDARMQSAPGSERELQLESEAAPLGQGNFAKGRPGKARSSSVSRENLERKTRAVDGGERQLPELSDKSDAYKTGKTDDGQGQVRKYFVLLRAAKEKGAIRNPDVPVRPVPSATGDKK